MIEQHHTGFYGDNAYVLMKLLGCMAKRSSFEGEFTSKLYSSLKLKDISPIGELEAVDTFFFEELGHSVTEFEIYDTNTIGSGCLSAKRIFIDKDERGEVIWSNGCSLDGYGPNNVELTDEDIVRYFKPELKQLIGFLERNSMERITVDHEETIRYLIAAPSTVVVYDPCFTFPCVSRTKVVLTKNWMKTVFDSIGFMGRDKRFIESMFGPSLNSPCRNPIKIEAARVRMDWLNGLLREFVDEADASYSKFIERMTNEIRSMEDSICNEFSEKIKNGSVWREDAKHSS